MLDAISYTFAYHDSLCALQLVIPSPEKQIRPIKFVICSKKRAVESKLIPFQIWKIFCIVNCLVKFFFPFLSSLPPPSLKISRISIVRADDGRMKRNEKTVRIVVRKNSTTRDDITMVLRASALSRVEARKTYLIPSRFLS